MIHRAARGEGPPLDERLARLLEVERRIEARLREAEEGARRRVDEARAASGRAAEQAQSEIDAAARDEEQADLERHAAELLRVETESAARVRALSALPEAVVEGLARDVVAAVVAGGGTAPP